MAEAARQAILAAKLDCGATDHEIAGLMGAEDEKTVKRLERKETLKIPASLFTAIGNEYGIQYIQPYLDLMGIKGIPKHCDEAINALPALTGLAAKMAAAMKDGRAEIDHVSLGNMLPELREVDGIISKLRAKAADMGMAA